MPGADGEVLTVGALILGANYRSLGIVRSLGRRGIPVWLVRSDEHRIAATSRYAAGLLPWPAEGDDRRLEYLEHLADARGWEGWTLFPSDDVTAALLSRHRDRVRTRFRVAVPSWEVLRFSWDKRLTHQLGEELGLPQPRTWLPAQLEDLTQVGCEFPAILKPAVKAELNPLTVEKAWPVADERELAARYEEARRLVPADEVMLQEIVPGGGESQLSFAALTEDGQVRASITARRVRQHPMDFGRASTCVESIEDEEAERAGRAVMEAMGATGMIEVEFKRDARDGRAKLLDINLRVWGWQSLGARAGVDFPHLYWRMLHGDPVPEARARPGVRWVRTVTDLPTALHEIAARRLSTPRYLASLRPPLEHAMFARDDPVPGLLDGPLLASLAVRRRLRGSPAPEAPPDRARPRVLVINENNPVPSDRRVSNQVRALHDGGYDVTVICPRSALHPEPHEVLEGIDVHRFHRPEADGGVLSYLAEYGLSFLHIWRLARRLSRERPFDAIQACNPPDGLLLTVLSLKRRGARLVFDHHDLVPEMFAERFGDDHRLMHWAVRAIERLNFRLADVVVATNESYRRVAIERGGKHPEDVFVVRSGPSLARFAPTAANAELRRGREHLIAYVGEMAPQDGIDHALRALAALHGRRDDWRAVFAGSGPVLDEMRDLAAQLGLNDEVEFAGWMEDPELRELLSTADVCLVPDPKTPANDASTLVKIAEYMAMSCPVVSYDLTESRVTAGDAALYAAPNDPDALARQLEDLLDDPELRERMGRAGRERVERELSWEHSAKALLGAYRHALA